MADELIELVREVQARVSEAATPYFTESEIENLRCLIRLTIEFSRYSDEIDLSSPIKDGGRYVLDSVLSGAESFGVVAGAYRVVVSNESSALEWRKIDHMQLRGEFASKFCAFLAETNFPQLCRLLLDLFKLQIVFCGMWYD